MIDSTVRHRGPSPFLIVGRKRQGRAGGGEEGDYQESVILPYAPPP